MGVRMGLFPRPAPFLSQMEANTSQVNVGTREATLVGSRISPGGRRDAITQRWKIEKIGE